MKKQFRRMALMLLTLIIFLNACSSAPGVTTETTVPTEATAPAETIMETTDMEIEPDPEWLSKTAIDEAYACLFPLEGEKNIELAQEILLPLVEMGNAEAQYYWGYIYDWEIVDNNGDGEKESLYWHTLALEQGFAKSYLAAALNEYIESEEQANELIELAKQAGLFEMTPEELGADGCRLIGAYYYSIKDYNSALEWFTKAADMGCTVSMYHIGTMYYNGTGVKKNIDNSLEWLLKAANLGNVYAMDTYGTIVVLEGYAYKVINQEYTTILDECRNSAEAGDPIAMYNLGQMYANGLGGLSWDRKKAFEWYLKAADLGDAYAMYEVGDAYEKGLVVAQDYNTAINWYLRASEHNHADSLSALGRMYNRGIEGVVEKDELKASEFWEKASKYKNIEDNDGHMNYASDYRTYKESVIEILQKAADAGNTNSMNSIGMCYYDGYVGQSTTKALDWLERAAKEENPDAMANLGYLYYRAENYDSAMEWLIKAYANGVEYIAEDINYMLTQKQGVNAYFEHYGELISSNP